MQSTSFKSRQENLLELISEGAILIHGGDLKQRSHDTEFPFRIHSDFKYLLGFDEPGTFLVITKNEEGKVRRHLFLRDKDPLMEMWSGKRLGVERAKEILTIDEAYRLEKLSETLPEILVGHKNLYFDFFNVELRDLALKTTETLALRRKAKIHKPLSWHDSRFILGKLRLIKDQNEIMALRKGMELTDLGHRMAMAKASEGVNEKEIENLLNFVFSQESGEGPAYDSIVAGGVNALILHYIENNQALKKGDLLLIDAGAQYNTYATDVTRTFPVSGKFSAAQAEVYTMVLEAQKTAFGLMKKGNTLAQIHEATSKSLLRSMIDADIIKGDFDQCYEEGVHRKYYPHGTGHWLGLDVHDMCPYLDEDLNDITLNEGMVFTCEPGLYFPENDPNIPMAFRGIGIRTEDDILMTKDGFENLSRSIPKEIKEVEEACSVDFKSLLEKLPSRLF